MSLDELMAERETLKKTMNFGARYSEVEKEYADKWENENPIKETPETAEAPEETAPVYSERFINWIKENAGSKTPDMKLLYEIAKDEPQLIEAYPDLFKQVEESEQKEQKPPIVPQTMTMPTSHSEPVDETVKSEISKIYGELVETAANVSRQGTQVSQQKPPAGLGKEVMPEYAGKTGYLTIYVVNGDYVRKINPKFIGFASDATMPELIPNGELWIERNTNEPILYNGIRTGMKERRAILDNNLTRPEDIDELDAIARKKAIEYDKALGMSKAEIQTEIEKHPAQKPDYIKPQSVTKEGRLSQRRQAMPKSIMNDKRFWQEEKPEKKEQPHKSQPPTSNKYLGMELLPVQI
jgi:hypothetical protein